MGYQYIESYLKSLKYSSLERKIPNISEENAEFIKGLIRERRSKHILEIGTANGYSALQFSTALEEGSDITTIEYAENAHREAVEHFSNCKVRNISAIYGDAKQVLPKLANEYFDFLYIDGMKREYLDYLLLALPKLTADAMIVIDDVEKFRHKMENLYIWIDTLSIPYNLIKTDPDDSIMIIERKNIRI